MSGSFISFPTMPKGTRSRIAVIASAALLLSSTSLAHAQSADTSKPNILFIMGDDIGYLNLSSYSGGIMGVETPNIDSIGRDGLRLTSFYAQPSCTAGRAAFITGQLPVRTGLSTVGTPGSPFGISDEDPTLAQVLKSNGYVTAQFGKNHLGDKDEMLPCNHGFDEFFGNLYHLDANEEMNDPQRPDTPFFNQFKARDVTSCTAGGEIKDEGPLLAKRSETFDDEINAKSLHFLDERAADKKPFFLWHAATRNHVFIYLDDQDKGLSPNGLEDVYGAALVQHDRQVGQLLDKLKETGLDQNTIVVYTTDNGAYQYMWPMGGTSPFRGDKGTTWEAGVRAPAMIRWPGAPGGRVSSEIVDMMDFFPTLARAGGEDDVVEKLKNGASYDGHEFKVHLDGVDQTDFFTGKSDKSNREIIYYYDGANFTAMRWHEYKVSFAAKLHDRWDNPLEDFGRPLVTNLNMDPFERQTGDLGRQYAEHKTWLVTPTLKMALDHVQTFKEFPPRPGMSSDVGKVLEKVEERLRNAQSQAGD